PKSRFPIGDAQIPDAGSSDFHLIDIWNLKLGNLEFGIWNLEFRCQQPRIRSPRPGWRRVARPRHRRGPDRSWAAPPAPWRVRRPGPPVASAWSPREGGRQRGGAWGLAT